MGGFETYAQAFQRVPEDVRGSFSTLRKGALRRDICYSEKGVMLLKRGTFSGGISPLYKKELARDKPLEVMREPERVSVPLKQHIGAPCTPLVSKGDDVTVGHSGWRARRIFWRHGWRRASFQDTGRVSTRSVLWGSLLFR